MKIQGHIVWDKNSMFGMQFNLYLKSWDVGLGKIVPVLPTPDHSLITIFFPAKSN
jgi:hypothetical protein